jgi:hypothetical protein
MTQVLSQNGWPALEPTDPTLHTWVVPAANGTFKLRLRQGSAGFLLAHYAMWHSEVVQDVTGKVADDWGYANRLIRGSLSEVSNHGSGTAIDLNAAAHVLGAVDTYSAHQEQLIHDRLHWMHGAIRWGGDYQHRKDEMHFEIVQSLAFCEHLARELADTPRGKKVLHANPGQRAVIFT